jgi:hypothetical protein
VIEAFPGHCTITVDGRAVDSFAALRAAVDTFNGARTSTIGIPPALDPNHLVWSEVERFVAGLARLEDTHGLAGAALELTRPELKLFALDGLGLHGLAGSFTLRHTEVGYAIEPAFDRRDVEADLHATEDFLAEQERVVAGADAALSAVTSQDADYPPRWVAALDARRLQVVGSIVLGVAVRVAHAFLLAETQRGEARPIVVMREGPADIAVLTARAATLDQAILNGPRIGRLPTANPEGGPGGAPGGAPGDGSGGAPRGGPGGAPGPAR